MPATPPIMDAPRPQERCHREDQSEEEWIVLKHLFASATSSAVCHPVVVDNHCLCIVQLGSTCQQLSLVSRSTDGRT